MIRINLLPVKAARKRATAERAILLIGLANIAVGGVLFILHQVQAGTLAKLRDRAGRMAEQIERLKEEVGDFDVIKGQKEELQSQKDVISKLEQGRTGPVNVLLELSRILSPGGQPTMDPKWYENLIRNNHAKAYDPTWDPRRLALVSFVDADDHASLIGYGRDNSDVAEFLRRLELSEYFDRPYIERSDTVHNSPAAPRLKHVMFSMTATVKYQ